ncbi:MAG: HAMP domain-containing protein, partial [Ignavibacteriales bacterium]|nr:HAMP domain-containing protein [Ignavibacteriales bacterium]
MQWFYNLRIGAKLILSFFLVAVIAGLIGYTGLSNISEIEQNGSEMYENMTVPIAQMAHIQNYFQKVRVNTRDILIADTPEEVAKFKGRINNYSRSIDSISAEFEKLILSDEMRRLYENLQAARVVYKRDLQEIIRLGEQQLDAEGFAMLGGDMEDHAFAEQDAIEEIIATKIVHAEDRQNANAAAAEDATTTMIIFLVVGVALAIILGYFISRIIGNPVRRLAVVAQRMAEGDVDISVEQTTNDEVGELEGSFAVLVENIRSHAAAAQSIADGDANVNVQVRSAKDVLGQSMTNVVESISGLNEELRKLILAAQDGRLDERGDASGFKGAYAEIVNGTNEMLDAILIPIGEGNRVLAQISKGKIDELVTEQYKGDHENMKVAVNNVATVLQNLQNELARLTDASRDGKLTTRGDADKFEGSYADIVRGLNTMLDAILHPIDEGNRVLRQIRGGNLRERVEIECFGDHQRMKDAINGVHEWLSDLIDYVTKIAQGDMTANMDKASDEDQIHQWLMMMKENIQALVKDVGRLADAALAGRLSERADAARHQGEYRQIVQGFNDTMDAIVDPINEASGVLEKMATGNMTSSMTGSYRGDHQALQESVNALVNNINQILQSVSATSEEVLAGSSQVADASQSLSQGATEQAASLEEISSSMNELSSQTKMNAENANQASALAVQARKSTERGDQGMQNLMQAMAEINESSKNISKIIKVIDEIAFQTNLLALNAAVEAARAGRHGKGFAVVAEEVRNLAARSAKAAKETAEMIETAIKRSENGFEIVNETAEILKEVTENSTKTADIVAEIAAASNEQAQGIMQINTGLSQVDKVTQQNTANAEESASASQELNGQA